MNATFWIPTRAQVVERVKQEILCQVAAGVIPPTVKDFGELHDYVDANCLGGFCEDGFADTLIDHFGGRDQGTEAMPDGMMDFLNGVQTSVSEWIAQGGLLDAMNDALRLRVANLLAVAQDFVASESNVFLGQLKGGLADLDSFGRSEVIDLTNSSEFQRFAAPLHLAAFAEQLHLALMAVDEARAQFYGKAMDFDGTTFEVALGNLVFALCEENGIDLDDEAGRQYCNRATAPEIAAYNLTRIKAHLGRTPLIQPRP